MCDNAKGRVQGLFSFIDSHVLSVSLSGLQQCQRQKNTDRYDNRNLVTWLSAMYSTSLNQHTAGLTMTEWIIVCVCVKARESDRDRVIKHGGDSCVK